MVNSEFMKNNLTITTLGPFHQHVYPLSKSLFFNTENIELNENLLDDVLAKYIGGNSVYKQDARGHVFCLLKENYLGESQKMKF